MADPTFTAAPPLLMSVNNFDGQTSVDNFCVTQQLIAVVIWRNAPEL